MQTPYAPWDVPMTEWFDSYVVPRRPGYYAVQNKSVNAHWKRRLVGPSFRYFDGLNWRTLRDGDISIFGKCTGHQWRGLANKPYGYQENQ